MKADLLVLLIWCCRLVRNPTFLTFFFFLIYEPRNPQGDEDWEDSIISTRTKRIRCSVGREAVLERAKKKKVNLPGFLPGRVLFCPQRSGFCRSSGWKALWSDHLRARPCSPFSTESRSLFLWQILHGPPWGGPPSRQWLYPVTVFCFPHRICPNLKWFAHVFDCPIRLQAPRDIGSCLSCSANTTSSAMPSTEQAGRFMFTKWMNRKGGEGCHPWDLTHTETRGEEMWRREGGSNPFPPGRQRKRVWGGPV